MPDEETQPEEQEVPAWPPVVSRSYTETDFKHALQTGDPLSYLVDRFASNIIGMDAPKRAVILALASCADVRTSRGREHTLLWGPPGSSKTSLLNAAARETFSVAYGPRMSTGGLTIDFRSGEVGVIAKVHESPFQALILDEMEKLDNETLEQLLMAMESGEITYAGGGNTGRIPAHVRIIAAVNDKAKLPRELVDRFDYQIYVPLPTRAQAYRVVSGMTDSYMNEKKTMGEGFVGDYLRWAREYKPEFLPEERKLADHIFKILVDSEPEEEIRLRRYPSILRTAYSLAVIEQSPVTGNRITRATRLLYPDWHIPALTELEEILNKKTELEHEINELLTEREHTETAQLHARAAQNMRNPNDPNTPL